MTARFDYYQLRPLHSEDLARDQNGTWLKDPQERLPGLVTLDCVTVPHVTLKSIAQNAALDGIFTKYEATLDIRIKALNSALAKAPKGLATQLLAKLAEKQETLKAEGLPEMTVPSFLVAR
jgi:adenine-specific DNA-methyltransferase